MQLEERSTASTCRTARPTPHCQPHSYHGQRPGHPHRRAVKQCRLVSGVTESHSTCTGLSASQSVTSTVDCQPLPNQLFYPYVYYTGLRRRHKHSEHCHEGDSIGRTTPAHWHNQHSPPPSSSASTFDAAAYSPSAPSAILLSHRNPPLPPQGRPQHPARAALHCDGDRVHYVSADQRHIAPRAALFSRVVGAAMSSTADFIRPPLASTTNGRCCAPMWSEQSLYFRIFS